MEEFTQALARLYARQEADKAGTKPTPEARQARIKELDREFRQRFIPAAAPEPKATPAPAPAPAATPATGKTTATADATAASNDPDVLRRLLKNEQTYRRWESDRADENQRALDLTQNVVRRLEGHVDYEVLQRALAERRAKLNHYGMVAGGALAGGTGAGLLSYLLAPRMSGLGRALTMVGGAAAGGAAAHYGSELVNDWLASR